MDEIRSLSEFSDLCSRKKREKVTLASWGKSVWIRELTVGERLEIENLTLEEDEKHSGRVMFEILKRCLQNGGGESLIAQDAKFETFLDGGSSGLYEAGLAALRVNKLTESALEETKKN